MWLVAQSGGEFLSIADAAARRRCHTGEEDEQGNDGDMMFHNDAV